MNCIQGAVFLFSLSLGLGQSSRAAESGTHKPEPAVLTATPLRNPFLGAFSSQPRAGSMELTGILWSKTGSYALVGNRIVKVGARVDGKTVTSIDAQGITLGAPPGRRLTLKGKS